MSDKLKKLWRTIGVGFVTGASDDDTSGITTYSIAGAKYGYTLLWAVIFILPFLIAIQEMSGRIGRITNMGLAGNIKKHYPRWLLFFISFLMVGANTINIGADISGMSQAVALVAPFPEKVMAIAMTLIILPIIIFMSYRKIFTIFKWLALSLFSYVLATFTIHQDWALILYHTVVPTIILNKGFFLVMIAFFGTTISPYLFFWQASQEVEEKIIEQCKPGRICKLKPATDEELRYLKLDTRVGMSFSNIITFFVITLTASTLFTAGAHDIATLRDAAEALRPLAGEYSYLLFMVGIISSGFLAIPVLAGSAAYVMAEVFGWSKGLNQTFSKAKEFYTIIIGATAIGLLIPIFGLNPVKTLFYTGILYGLISPILIIMVIHMANNKKIVGEHTNSKTVNILGYSAFTFMTFFAVLIFFVL